MGIEHLISVSSYDLFLPFQALSECGQSVKSAGSDRQEWSYTLYDFEGQGHVTRDVCGFLFLQLTQSNNPIVRVKFES